jgi:hypothetical protein
MNGFNDRPELTVDDLFAFATGRADEETRARVKNAMSDHGHPVSRLIRTEQELLAEMDSMESNQDFESDSDAIDNAVRESFESEIQSYLAWEQSRLDDELSQFLPEEEAAVVRKSGGKVSPLRAYLAEIRRVVCTEWDWCNRRDQGSLKEPVNQVIALADSFVVYAAQVPFPPTLLAVCVVKIGLDRLCRERKS